MLASRSSAGRRSSPTTRASRARAATASGARALGYFVPTIPLFALGAVIALSRHISDAPGAADRGRRRRRREPARAARADRRRERRGVRERLLGRGQPAEPRAAGRRSACSSAAIAAIATVGALVIDLRNYQPFLYLLGSFFVPLFGVLLADWLLAGPPLRPRRRLPRAGVPARDDRRLARRLLPLPVALPATARRGGRTSSRTRARTRCRGAARRCRASRSRSCSPPSHALLARRPILGERVIALIGNLSRDVLPGSRPRIGGGSYHGARALQRLRVPARVVARCAAERPRRAAAAARAARDARPLRRPASDRRRSRSPTTATAARCASTRSANRGSPTTSRRSRPSALGARRAARAPRVPGRDAGGARAPLPRLARRPGARARAAGGAAASSTTTSTASSCGTSGS